MLRDLFSLFPAYAGVILYEMEKAKDEWPFPRIRGGDPQTRDRDSDSVAFSPHTRG